MPTYIFECYADNNGCGNTFEIQAKMSEASSLTPTCPKCKKRKSVSRNYLLQDVLFVDNIPKTLGALADKNAKRLSKDEKESLKKKHTAYRDATFTGSLPKGASLYPVDSSGKKIPSSSQLDKDPKKKRKKK